MAASETKPDRPYILGTTPTGLAGLVVGDRFHLAGNQTRCPQWYEVMEIRGGKAFVKLIDAA